jgi:excisionase family DNA binding protein
MAARPEKLRTTQYIADLFGVSDATIYRRMKDGTIKSVKLGTSRTSPRRIPESEVKRLLSEGLK